VTLDPRLLRPWRLPPNRVERFYLGGALLDRFRDAPLPADSRQPEDWVGSATRAWSTPGAPATDDGLGEAEIGGRRERIADLLAADPAAVAGTDLVAAAGPTLGVLVKLLDAGVRLPVHGHPDRAFARSHLGSFFGKAEAWLIQATRDVGDPAAAGVWIGFRRDLGRSELIDLIEGQDTDALLAAMHHRSTRPGDAWFIPPGVPHAIGAGVFMVEIEEPSDFSIVAETRGIPIEPADAHLGLGWEVAVDAFDRTGHDDAWLGALRHDGRRPATNGPGWRREPLTDSPADPYFRAERLTVEGSATSPFDQAAFLVGVVTGGGGRIRAGSGELDVKIGDTFAVPAAALVGLELESAGRLELIACLPPDPAHLISTEDAAAR
jgi:mannose-6-phosphate isomerase